MSGQRVPSAIASPTTRGRVFVVVDASDKGWATDLIAVEPGPVVYARRGGIWLRDVLLERRLARGALMLRELRDRALISTEMARFDASRGDSAARAVQRLTTEKSTTDRRVERAAEQEARGTPVEAKAVDAAARRAAAAAKFEVAAAVTASAGPPRTAVELRASHEDLQRRRQRRQARRSRRAEDARHGALLASAMRRGAEVTYADVRR